MRNVNIHGFTFLVEQDPADYWQWIEDGVYKSDFSTIKHFASPNVVCIDIGAWIGADTLFASKLYKCVYGIEPDPVAWEILNKNINVNSLSNISLYNIALMGHIGVTSMGGALLGCSCTRQTCKENSVTVPCITLREFCKDIPDPLFIKMDTEGAEVQILEDWKFFAERKPDLMLSTHLRWWKEGGSNGKMEYATITKVGNLYKNAYNSDGKSRLNFNTEYGDVIFTDKDI
jgi:FkbM family methyltransferase